MALGENFRFINPGDILDKLQCTLGCDINQSKWKICLVIPRNLFIVYDYFWENQEGCAHI